MNNYGKAKIQEVHEIHEEQEELNRYYPKILPKHAKTVSAVTNELNDVNELFVKQMRGIVDALPISNTNKSTLKRDITFYGIDFVRYSQFQTNNPDEEDPWAVAISPLAIRVIDSINDSFNGSLNKQI